MLETYGSRMPSHTAAIDVHNPGDVNPRDHFLYWGFPTEGLRRLGRIVGLDQVEIPPPRRPPANPGHPRRPADQ